MSGLFHFPLKMFLEFKILTDFDTFYLGEAKKFIIL